MNGSIKYFLGEIKSKLNLFNVIEKNKNTIKHCRLAYKLLQSMQFEFRNKPNYLKKKEKNNNQQRKLLILTMNKRKNDNELTNNSQLRTHIKINTKYSKLF